LFTLASEMFFVFQEVERIYDDTSSISASRDVRAHARNPVEAYDSARAKWWISRHVYFFCTARHRLTDDNTWDSDERATQHV
jgi:hypothetical protein